MPCLVPSHEKTLTLFTIASCASVPSEYPSVRTINEFHSLLDYSQILRSSDPGGVTPLVYPEEPGSQA